MGIDGSLNFLWHFLLCAILCAATAATSTDSAEPIMIKSLVWSVLRCTTRILKCNVFFFLTLMYYIVSEAYIKPCCVSGQSLTCVSGSQGEIPDIRNSARCSHGHSAKMASTTESWWHCLMDSKRLIYQSICLFYSVNALLSKMEIHISLISNLDIRIVYWPVTCFQVLKHRFCVPSPNFMCIVVISMYIMQRRVF